MRKNQFRLKPAYAAVLLAFAAQTTQANPIGAAVVAGQASFATAGKTLTVTNTPNTIINWQGFSIGANEITRFAQQSASSAVLNRVIANNPSNILGSLQSNGRVFLVNPSGIVFGANATVNVAGMVASTLNLSNSDFLAGRYRFTNPSPTGGGAGVGVVVNAGNLTAQTGGQIYLIAPNVENTGIINAPNGEILLAAGHSVELVNSNDPNLRVNITAPAGDATNIGQLVASSGSLGLFGAVVRNTGTVSADSATMQGGKIVFKASQRVDAGGTISATTATAPVPSPTGGGLGRGSGGTINILADMQTGTVNVTGTLDASSIAPSPSIPLPQGGEGSVVLPSTTALLPSPLAGEGLGERGNSTNGGFIETSAAHVNIADTARVTTASALGLAGTWLIDPFDFTIAAAGGNMTGAVLTANLAGGNISILSTTGNSGTLGDVNVNDIVTWSANKLTLNAQNNINLNANLNGSGSASLALEYGQVSAGGGTSTYNVNAAVNLPAGNNFSTKLGSTGAVKNYTVITSLGAAGSTTATDLQGMNGGLALNYALGGNIDAAGTSAWNTNAGFTPVGTLGAKFTGTFDGLGHTISGLTINLPAIHYVGLFGYAGNGSALQNVGLVGGSVSGYGQVGGLVGRSWGVGTTVSNSYNTGSVSGSGEIGGLVGGTYGTISNSYATGSVNGNCGGACYVGGLVGRNYGGTVSNSHATGNVSGNVYVGGLVGESNNNGTISNSYATGSVNGGASVGGLVGWNGACTISNSYATGSVSGYRAVGGLVGEFSGTVSNSYATGSVKGTWEVGGLVGNSSGTISNGYATGSVVGTNHAGGLVGRNYGAVSTSYATGSVSGSSGIGGLVGRNGNGGTATNCYATGSVGGSS
jgi:filamentous hemagglutinin family protein